MGKKLLEKLKEALLSVMPILVIVLALHFTIAPCPALFWRSLRWDRSFWCWG